MKKTGIFAAVIIVACTAVYVVSNILVNNKEAESQKDIQSADDKSVVYASLDEIRSQAADELDDIKNGKYPNMKCGDIHLDITDADTIRNINISQMNQLGKDNLEIIENQKKLLEEELGDGLVEECFLDGTSNLKYEEAKKAIEDGTYHVYGGTESMLPTLGYTLSADSEQELHEKLMDENYDGQYDYEMNPYNIDTYKYGHVVGNLASVWINKGKIFSYENNNEREEPEEYFEVSDSWEIEDAEMDKKVTLSNGDISIGDATQYVEEYFRDKLPYEVNPEVEKIVDKVSIIKINDDINALMFKTTREYNGMKFESDDEGAAYFDIPKYCKDISESYMIDTDDIDIYSGDTCAVDIKVESETDKCVTLASAVQIVSQSIGENSEYDISAIDTVYRNLFVDTSINELQGTPCWRILGRNITSNETIDFYVNMADGKLDYEKRPV